MYTNKTVFITHDDLDGFGSGWLFRSLLPDMLYGSEPLVKVTCSYPDQLDGIECQDCEVIILDLAAARRHYEKFTSHGNSLLVIDHHPETVRLIDEFPESNILSIDTFRSRFVTENNTCTVSAARLVFEYADFLFSTKRFKLPSEYNENQREIFEDIAMAISMQDTGNIPPLNFETATTADEIILDAKRQPYFIEPKFYGFLLSQVSQTLDDSELKYTKMLDLIVEHGNIERALMLTTKYREAIYNSINTAMDSYKAIVNAREVMLHYKDKQARVACCGKLKSLLIASLSYFAKHEDPADMIVCYDPTDPKKTISIRSSPHSKISANALATRFGGGGHKLASGVGTPDGVDELATLLGYPPRYMVAEIL